MPRTLVAENIIMYGLTVAVVGTGLVLILAFTGFVSRFFD